MNLVPLSTSVSVSVCVFVCCCSLVALSQAQKAHVNVGCFSNAFLEENSFYYRLEHTVTRSGCALICSRRLTTHYAVSDGLRPAKHQLRCYCGNDLTNVSTVAEDSTCAACYPEASMRCGGEHTMTVYKTAESTPLAFLYGKVTDRAFLNVTMYRHDFKRSVNLITTAGIAKVGEVRGLSDIDYEYNKNIIFFSTAKKVFKSYLDSRGAYGEISELPTVGLDPEITTHGVATDWVTGILYWVNCNREDKCDICHHNDTCFRTREGGVYMFVIDPLTRTAFVLNQYQMVSTYDLDNGKFLKTFELTSNFTVLAVDIHSQLLYAAHTRNDVRGSSQKIISMRYDGTDPKEVLGGGLVAGVNVLLDIDGDQMLWTSCARQNNCTIYGCKLTGKGEERKTCREPDITRLLQENQRITDIRIFHPKRQTPSKASLCKKLECSHSCEQINLFTARCSCPAKMQLINGTICQGPASSLPESSPSNADVSKCNLKLAQQTQKTQELSEQLRHLQTENDDLHRTVLGLQNTIQNLQGQLDNAHALLKIFDSAPCRNGWYVYSVWPCLQLHAERQVLIAVLNGKYDLVAVRKGDKDLFRPNVPQVPQFVRITH